MEDSRLPAIEADTTSLYLELLRKVLVGRIYSDLVEYHRVQFRRGSWQALLFHPLAELLALKSYSLHKRVELTPQMIQGTAFWPAQGLTMIGEKRLENVETCLRTALRDRIEGDVIETGVWRGGTVIFMKALLDLHGSEKKLFVADSFCGVPRPTHPKDASEDRREAFYKFDQLAVPRSEVEANFRRLGLFDERVIFLEGWFKDTLPTAPIEKLALMRLDGDLYEPTWDALTNLYPKLSPEGFCLIDDYGGIRACKHAVEDYREMARIREAIVAVDRSGVYWRKAEGVKPSETCAA